MTLVDLRKGPIRRGDADRASAPSKGIHELDVIIYATGFDAMTGALTRIDVRGRDGVLLRDFWATEGPISYLGLAVAGFPNLFIVQAPGSPCGRNELRRRAGAARRVDRRLHRAICGRTATAPSRRCPRRSGEWIEHTTALVAPTVLVHPSCNSWYNGGNVPGKKRMYMGYVGGDPGVPPALRRDRRDGLHRLQARLRACRRTRAPAHRPGSSAGCCRERSMRSSDTGDWNAGLARGLRQLGEVALDELVVTGMTLTCAAAAAGAHPLSYYGPAVARS